MPDAVPGSAAFPKRLSVFARRNTAQNGFPSGTRGITPNRPKGSVYIKSSSSEEVYYVVPGLHTSSISQMHRWGLLLAVSLGTKQVLGELYQGPTPEILNRTYDVIVVGGR